MGKLTTYLIIMSGLMLLFYFTGLLQDTGNSTLLTLLLNPEDLQDSGFKIQVFLVLEGIAAVAVIAIGVITGNLELAVMAPFAIYLFNLGWDFLKVFTVVAEANPVFGTLIFAPVLLLYGVAIVEFWRGRD